MKKFDKQTYDNNYMRQYKDRLSFIMPNGYKALIKEAAISEGISAGEFVRSAIEDKLKSCGVEIKQLEMLQKNRE